MSCDEIELNIDALFHAVYIQVPERDFEFTKGCSQYHREKERRNFCHNSVFFFGMKYFSKHLKL